MSEVHSRARVGAGQRLRYRLQDFFGKSWSSASDWVDAKFGDEKTSRDETLTRNFTSDANAIAAAPVPISAHIALWVVLALIASAILWAVFGSLDRIVVAPGKIATRAPMVVMQPFTTSRITQIYVKPGDHVRKGHVLVSFDPAFAQADQITLEQKARELGAQVDRFQAELAGARTFPAKAGDSAERVTQSQIFSQEMAEYSAQMAERDSRAGAIDSQLNALNAELPGMRRQVEMAKKVAGIQEYLQSQKAAADLDVLRAQSSQIDAESHLTDAEGNSKKLVEQRTEIEAERRTFLDKWRSDHNQQLVQARQGLAQTTEELIKARRMKDFTELKAPVDAVVLEIADRSVGSVMREAETLVTLVPDAANLYVEAGLPSRDVSYVHVGDRVHVKLEAYPFQRYGTLDGILDVISADSVPLKADDASHLIYPAQVRLTGTPAELAKRGIHLRPGLVATAEITTGKRSIASYIFDPILGTANESLREP